MNNNITQTKNNLETIEVLSKKNHYQMRWEPIVGSEFLGLINYLKIPEKSKKSLTNESRRILGKCVPPTLDSGAATGLVVGYVQSGKTLSFTAVSALARDNNYPILIVVAGISVPLSSQSKTRLQRDLRLDTRTDRKWPIFENPNRKNRDEDAMRRIIDDWRDPLTSDSEHQTILITVMKNHTHLKHLISVLKELNLNGIPALIIDDEADQASPNTKAQKEGEESTTYSCIMELCRQLSHHTFLQYTATPQAPLLINIIDKLSPSFTEILTPGPGYIGGKKFFIEHPELIYTIPDSESVTAETQEPPDTLIYALEIFFLGVAAAKFLKEDQENNRSMLIHPSFHTKGHSLFFQWVSEIQNRFEQTFNLPENDPDKKELIDEFHKVYEDLKKTVKNLPKFEELLSCLPRAIRSTRKVLVNSKAGRTPTIDWKSYYAYILIGGQAMDRGFTVEGLTVTYMSRGIGVGNADTLQQRARFFGYKERYLGYCRIFLDHQMEKAFKDYVEHEEDVQMQLKEYSNSGKPLSEWKRAFLMPDRLHPTRRNILKDNYIRDIYSDRWYAPRFPCGSLDFNEKNEKTIKSFIGMIKLAPDKGHKERPLIQKHLVNDQISLQTAYEKLLSQFLISNKNDSQNYTGLLLQLKNFLEHNPNEMCTLYIMSCESLSANWQIRERSLEAAGNIKNLFQGAHPDTNGAIYPGDRNIGDKKRVVIELHRLRIIDSTNMEVATDIKTIAVWVPEKMGRTWLVQDQENNK